MNSKAISVLALPISQRDHIQGATTAPFSLVQYGDYQCPHSGAIYPILQSLLQELGDQVCFAYRHFPRSNIHPDAQHAAEAAEAAASQEKFWQMHDCLFTHQHALGNGYLVDYAALIGLNVQQFLREMGSDLHVNRVWEDMVSGTRSGVRQTPTLFVNGSRYSGEWSEGSLRQTLLQG
ncbi:MAG: thioredoxin domain-containing protein [Synechococcales bacterium]|nr:thioredoxin domain-containing protein [Synechococcales bacterium]